MSPAVPGAGALLLSTLPFIFSSWGGRGLPGTAVGLWYSQNCPKAPCLPSVASLRFSAAASGFWLVAQGFGQAPALLTLLGPFDSFPKLTFDSAPVEGEDPEPAA